MHSGSIQRNATNRDLRHNKSDSMPKPTMRLPRVPAVTLKSLIAQHGTAMVMTAVTMLCFGATEVSAADASAAQSLAQKSGCFKCHGVDKKKDGPALRDAAAKYRGNADAQQKLIYHVTSGEMVKFDDGHEEAHKKVKSSDANEVKNLVDWILSLEGGTKY